MFSPSYGSSSGARYNDTRYYTPVDSEAMYRASEMAVVREMEEEMVWEPEVLPAQPLRFLAVDTNIFISHLNLFRTIHALLLGLDPSPLILLIPSTVIYELDHLKDSSDKPELDSPISVGRLVRTATSWLLDVEKTRRESKKGALRCQSLKERYDPTVREHGSADDQILDCCLHFEETGGKVVLWTNDKNLSVKAETNHIPTIGGRHASLRSILRGCGVNFPERLWKDVAALGGVEELHEFEGAPNHWDGDVDMDMDMEVNVVGHILRHGDQSHSDPNLFSIISKHEERRYPYLIPATNPALASSSPSPFSPSPIRLNASPMIASKSPQLLSSSSKASPPNNRSPSMNGSPFPSRQSSPIKVSVSAPIQSTTPSKLLLTSLQLSLLPATRHLLASTSPTTPLIDTAIPTLTIISTLLNSLSIFDKRLIEEGYAINSIERITILRSIASVRTINDFVTYHERRVGGRRRPRSGEVVDAVKAFVECLGQLGVEGGEGLEEIVGEIERLI
ncbi:hypothetical protein CI109_101822 [Kwoniella shandongensis]|uniref:Uncharacterized protein n=1 Tax=Kwoniella shandongensis TaxID=1734106 RepID=A0A5M6C534_9TREE|nr:uncharacterized protein CI109_001056 [Kwoniella shandongensis]KAA5530256.1 hypothetical protein CI109_001056 [Kwoniella shandongensis]